MSLLKKGPVPVRSREPQPKSVTFSNTNFENVKLSPDERAELLDPQGWNKVLETYANTMGLAVALTDPQGRLLGACHNPQPIWSMVNTGAEQRVNPQWAISDEPAACPFCLSPGAACSATRDALRTGEVVMVHDQAGFAHVTVALSLGDEQLGTIIAGQVFDRYPEPLPLQRMARHYGISVQNVWRESRRQAPISQTKLKVYGDVLHFLGQAYVRQRYAAILDQRLLEVNHRHRLLIEGVKDYALFTVDRAGEVTSWNSGAERLYGYTEEEMVGEDFARLFTPQDVENDAPAEEIRKAERDGWEEEGRWQVRKDGTRFYGVGAITAIGEGDFLEFGRVMHDVTERRAAEEALSQARKLESIRILERRVEERTRELAQSNEDLKRANQDLEEFAYTASHDLQEPLRNVAAYSQLFKKLYWGKLDDQADEFLGYMENGARRMELLIKDLLVYTRTTAAAEEPIVSIEAAPVLATAIRNLAALIRDSDASITFGKLPVVPVAEIHLQQIFQNLLSNAMKYRKAGKPAAIHISAERQSEGWVFSVKDNGIGIDGRYGKRVFGLFKRLHAPEKYSGTGIGLAICHKIVERYRGRIWVESELGNGSTFRFLIPVAG
jgi:PAS domain S-box-containing protein